MFTQQGPGGVYYSAVQAEPTMHPLIEGALSLTPYAAGIAGARYLMNSPYKGVSDYTSYDILQKQIRNIANKTPFGFANTFRAAEFMSPYLSTKAMELETGQSLEIGKGKVGKYYFEATDLQSVSTQRALNRMIGEESFSKIRDVMDERGAFRLVYEQEMDVRGRGSLFFEEMERKIVEDVDPKTGETISVEKNIKKQGGKIIKLSDDMALMNLRYSADLFDLLAELNVTGKINPAYQAIIQNLNLKGINFEEIFKNSQGEVKRLGLIPSPKGQMGSVEDLMNRLNYPTAHLSAGINRFNRLIAATKEQIPFATDFLEKFGKVTGLGLTTTPGPFYKQFGELGVKASAIGAAYLGVQTLDHYRRQGGVLGNVAASAGTAFGVSYLYNKMYKGSERTMSAGKVGAIAFGAQMLLPGFSQGLIEGGATTLANLDIGRAYLGKMTGMSFYRRGLEGLFPGISSPTTGMFLGIGLAALAYKGYGGGMLARAAEGKLTSFDKFLNKLMPEGLRDSIGFDILPDQEIRAPLTRGQIERKELFKILTPTSENNISFDKFNPLADELKNLDASDPRFIQYNTKLNEIIQGTAPEDLSSKQVAKLRNFFKDNELLLRDIGGIIDVGERKAKVLDTEYQIHARVRSQVYEETFNFNSLNTSLLQRIETINKKYEGGSFIDSVLRRTEIFGAEMYHAFFGASLKGETIYTSLAGEEIVGDYSKLAKDLKAKPIFGRFGTLAIGGLLLQQLATGGLFGTMEDADELKDIYSGKRLIEMKAGRFWEGGGSPYEGNQTSYFKPSEYSILMSQARERAVWGDEVDKFNPITRFFLKNFTYHLEEKNYYDRPYPITGAAFETVPVLGPLLANTIGKLIKPPKLMHEEELYRVNEEGNTEYMFLKEFGTVPEFGQAPPGTPTSPYGLSTMLGSIQYQFREIEGITGYAKNYMQKLVTGRETLGTRQFLMSNANQMESPILDYWDMELGGLAFTSEPIRRLLPRPRGDIEYYNPIANTMPSYLPEKFKTGDPYRKIASGFARLPGKGYEAVNPDVAGIDPEDYPLIHKYKILADVAPSSRNTMKMREQLFERRAAGLTTEHENEMMDRITEYHQKRLAATRDFEFAKNAILIPGVSEVTRSLYQGAESVIRKVTAPAEYLIPGGFRPTSKLLGKTRSAIEVYEQERMYGTVNAFWDKHERDWFRPAMLSAANLLGWEGKPAHVERREQTNEYFDKLNFLKFMRLAQNAENPKDRKRYYQMAGRTRTGVNPQGDALGIYLSLPNAEKRFFDAFANAKQSDRARILELVPEDQAQLYTAVWERLDQGENVSLMMGNAKGDVDIDYMQQQYMRLEEYFQNKPMPGPDWIGWHKDIDINDIKIKHIANTAEEISDYDVWQSQVRRVSRRAYLENSDLFMYTPNAPNRTSMRARAIRGFKNQMTTNIDSMLINSGPGGFENSRADIYYNDNRSDEILSLFNSMYGNQ